MKKISSLMAVVIGTVLLSGCLGIGMMDNMAKDNLGGITTNNIYKAPGFGIQVTFPKDWKFIYQEKIDATHRDIGNGFYHAEAAKIYYTRLIHDNDKPLRHIQISSVWQNSQVTDDYAKKEVMRTLAGAYEPITGWHNIGPIRVFWGLIIVSDKQGFKRLEGSIMIHKNNYAYTSIRYTADAGKTEAEQSKRLDDFNTLIKSVNHYRP